MYDVLAKAGALVPAAMDYQISSCCRSYESRAYCVRDSCYRIQNTRSPPLMCPAIDGHRRGASLAKRAETRLGEDTPSFTYTEQDLVPQRVTAAAEPAVLARVLNPVRLPIGRIWVSWLCPEVLKPPRDEASG